MAIRIGQAPESDFTNPLGMLSDCHRRIERFLALLIQVAEQARADADLDQNWRDALTVALRYFREAAPHHTRDEEESLFPRLRACGDVRAQTVLTSLDLLHEDHAAAEARHQEVEALGRLWLAEGRLTPEASRRMVGLLEELRAIYQRHIKVEDAEIFPLAGELLRGEEVEALGREMAARRGIARGDAAVSHHEKN